MYLLNVHGSPAQTPDAGDGAHEKETELPETDAEKFWGGDDAIEPNEVIANVKNKKAVNNLFINSPCGRRMYLEECANTLYGKKNPRIEFEEKNREELLQHDDTASTTPPSNEPAPATSLATSETSKR